MAPFVRRKLNFKLWEENSLGNLRVGYEALPLENRASLQVLHCSVETKHNTVNVFPFP